MKYDVELDHVTKIYNDTIAVDDVSTKIEKGKLTFLLGPSGCGKTTTLRMIGGLEELTSGVIRIKGEDVTGMPAFKRPTRTVFQEWLLFPHMSVYDNIAYGLNILKVKKTEKDKRIKESLHLLGLEGYENRRPDQLSGGEKQRIALARALVCRPGILLLDEPIGSLDAKMRKHMQIQLKSLQKELGITFIYVTHDQEEALIMADTIVIMNKGRIEQVGTPKDIYDKPKTKFVADFIGETNLIPCKIIEEKEKRGEVTVSADGLNIITSKIEGLSMKDECFISVRPHQIKMSNVKGLKNIFSVIVRNVIFQGDDIRFILEAENGRMLNLITSRRDEYERINSGQKVEIGWNIEDSVLVGM